jgi:NTE family protein
MAPGADWTPDGPVRGPKARVALALSGGGYRAMLFHLGALYRLNELGLLGRIERFSSVSGGSFVAGMLARAWPRLKFRDGRAANFEREVARPIDRLSRLPLDAPIVTLGLLPGVNPAHLLRACMDRLLFHGLRLDELPDTPRFIFNATHLATGTGWRFSKPYMGTYRVGLIKDPTTPVATAVAASAAFPPIVSPLVLQTSPADYRRVKGADLFDEVDLRGRVLLLDGGAYDNMAVEPLDDRAETLLVSDGGGNLAVDASYWRFRLWSMQLRRVIDMSTEQGRDLRRRDLVRRAKARELKLALWRTISDPADYPAATSRFQVSESWRTYLSTRPTRMWPMPRRDRDALVDWGYLAADMAVRSFVLPGAPAPKSLPRRTDFSLPAPAGPPTGAHAAGEKETDELD